MSVSSSLSDREAEAERRIDWVLAHPGVTPWVKDALRAALPCDPIVALNDVEMLRELLRSRAEAIVDRCLRIPGRPTESMTRGEPV